MFVMREVVHCRPGKAGEMVKRFKALGVLAEKAGYEPFKIMTDLSGEQFWTVVTETQAKSLDAFGELEQKVMGMDEARKIMSGYHDLIIDGRRELYKLET